MLFLKQFFTKWTNLLAVGNSLFSVLPLIRRVASFSSGKMKAGAWLTISCPAWSNTRPTLRPLCWRGPRHSTRRSGKRRSCCIRSYPGTQQPLQITPSLLSLGLPTRFPQMLVVLIFRPTHLHFVLTDPTPQRTHGAAIFSSFWGA